MRNVKSILAASVIAASGSAVLALPAAIGLVGSTAPAYAKCDPGTKIDKSTVADARREMRKAGFGKIHDLKKGCDNYWHGVAMKGGTETHVAAAPDGKVMTEGD